MNNNEHLLSYIKELCKQNKETIASLEKELGIGAGTISRWSKASPSLDKILAIAGHFHVSIDELVGYSKDAGKESQVDDTTLEIIKYLKLMTVNREQGRFWHDYKTEEHPFELKENEWQVFDSDMGKMFYAYDEDGYYLLEVIYVLNSQCDYETQIRLYLLPDVNTAPQLECDEKNVLQELYILIIEDFKKEEADRCAKEKVKDQRTRIVEKLRSME